MMYKWFSFYAGIAVIISLFMLNGCNTIAGAGKDMSKAGQAVTKTAVEAKESM